MPSNAFSGVGTIFNRWDPTAESSTGAWVALAEVKNISGPGMTREVIDVTSLDSTGGYREKIASIRDAGQLTFTMHFTRTNYDLMKADFENDELQNYQVQLPDAEQTTMAFTGLVTSLPTNIVVDDAVTIDITIEISGSVTVDSGGNS